MKTIINQSKFILAGCDIELLALSLKYIARRGVTQEDLVSVENDSSPFADFFSDENSNVTGYSTSRAGGSPGADSIMKNVIWAMRWSETVPSMATRGLFPVNLRNSELVAAEPSRNVKKDA